MEEGVVRMAAGMYAYVADMEAVKARIKAMETCNVGRDEPLYGEEHFFHAEQELECIAKALREKI